MKTTHNFIEYNGEEIDIDIDWILIDGSCTSEHGNMTVTENLSYYEPISVYRIDTKEEWEFSADPRIGSWEEVVMNDIINNRIDHL